jgi:hypothetical protein
MSKPHPHPFVIADSDAVRTLSVKVEDWGQYQQRRERLLKTFSRGCARLRKFPQRATVGFFTVYREPRVTVEEKNTYRPGWRRESSSTSVAPALET